MKKNHLIKMPPMVPLWFTKICQWFQNQQWTIKLIMINYKYKYKEKNDITHQSLTIHPFNSFHFHVNHHYKIFYVDANFFSDVIHHAHSNNINILFFSFILCQFHFLFFVVGGYWILGHLIVLNTINHWLSLIAKYLVKKTNITLNIFITAQVFIFLITFYLLIQKFQCQKKNTYKDLNILLFPINTTSIYFNN